MAGQGTLDRFLSPAHGKQIQKQLAKPSKHRSKEHNNRQDLEAYRQGSNIAVPSRGQKRGRPNTLNPEAVPQDAGQAKGCLKWPRRQMVPLYDEHEGEPDQKDDPAPAVGSAETSARKYVLSDDDTDFQPSKMLKQPIKRRKAVTAKTGSKKQNDNSKAGQASKKAASDVVPAVSFDSFSYSKGSSKSKALGVAAADDKGEVCSARKAPRTRSSSAYTGLY